ncbi:MAG: PAS domain S-box protein [Bacteroidota bacterium]
MKNTSDKPSSGILRQKAEDLLKKKSEARILELIEELANQNEEKTKRADKLIFVNKELVFEQENLRKIASLVPGVVYQYLLRPDGTSCFPYASEAIREMYRVSPDEVREDASEEKLKQVSARAELAARAGGVGIWDYDIVNDILLWDDQMFALYGITGKEFIGVYEAWQAGVHPDDKERGDKEIQMAILSEKEFDTEFRVVWPDNSIHNIRALAVVQHDDSGKALRMIGTNWDITELRKAEKEKLDDSESRYRSIFHGSPDGIMITDEETKMIMFANPTQCEMLGYTEDELKTMTIAGIHHADTLQETLAEFESLAQGKKTNGENIQCLRKNGEIFYADIASSFMTINGRKCLVGFFRDITKRRQAEEALHKSNAYLENLINYANTPIIVWDPQFHITRFNHAFEHLTGCNEAEVLGKSIDVLFPPSQVSHAMSLIHKTLSGERWETVEIEILHRDESIRTLLWNSATLFAPDGYTPTATIAQGYDIIQRKQAEIALKEALVKAESGDRLKTAFLQNISHEVRTPLNGILGFGNLLAEPDLTAEEKQGYTRFLKASSDRLINTITDYLDISLIVTGNVEVKPKDVNAAQLLKELQTRFQYDCDTKNIALKLVIPKDQEHFSLITDPELLHKCISCLLNNAIKFTNHGTISIGYSKKSHSVEFFVIDTGIGIDSEAQERIFEPFVHENLNGMREYQGSGLGLPIIKGFLKLLGGEIRLESEKDKGAAFFFSLPQARSNSIWV